MLHLHRFALTGLVLASACKWPLPIDVPVDVPVETPVAELPPLEPPCDQADCGGPTPDCLFGEAFWELEQSPYLSLSPDEWIRADNELTDPDEREQLVRAVQQSTHRDVSTVAEALERVDQGEVRRIWLTSRSDQRRYVVYEYGAGDNSYGAFFMAGDPLVLATIHDGDVLDCRVYHH